LPTLLIQGQQDQIINANSSVKLLGKLASTDKNILMLPSSGHILIGTSYVKPEVEDAIIDWLAAHGGLKGGIVSHVMPPSAPDFHTFSRTHMPEMDAMRGSGGSPVYGQDWRHQPSTGSAPLTPFTSNQSPAVPDSPAEPLTPFSSMPGTRTPRYQPSQLPPKTTSELMPQTNSHATSEPSSADPDQSTVSRNAPVTRGENGSTTSASAASSTLSSTSSELTQMQLTTTDSTGSSLQPDKPPETPPPSLSELLHSLGDKSVVQSDVQEGPSTISPGSVSGAAQPAQNPAVSKDEPEKESMPPLRESVNP
jgi:hypothetical protein